MAACLVEQNINGVAKSGRICQLHNASVAGTEFQRGHAITLFHPTRIRTPATTRARAQLSPELQVPGACPTFPLSQPASA